MDSPHFLWFQRLNVADRRLVIISVVFLGLLAVAVVYCNLKSEHTIEGFERLHALPAKVCVDIQRCEEDVILLKGQIVKSSESVILDVKRLVKQGYKTVCFDSPGGDNGAALLIGESIAELGLDTCISHRYVSPSGASISDAAICNSACPWIFLAGHKRVAMSEHASIGFHASQGSVRLCHWTVFHYEVPEERQAYQKIINYYGVVHGASAVSTAMHARLLNMSFEFGTGPTKAIPVRDLYEKFAFFTEVRVER